MDWRPGDGRDVGGGVYARLLVEAAAEALHCTPPPRAVAHRCEQSAAGIRAGRAHGGVPALKGEPGLTRGCRRDGAAAAEDAEAGGLGADGVDWIESVQQDEVGVA